MRRKVGNELQVSRIPMSHSTPLKYEFMTKLQNMLPEALEIGEQCVIRQLVILLNDSEDNLRRDFDQVFGPFGQCPPYNGADWRDVGIHCDLLIAFAELRGIELYIFSATIKHITLRAPRKNILHASVGIIIVTLPRTRSIITASVALARRTEYWFRR